MDTGRAGSQRFGYRLNDEVSPQFTRARTGVELADGMDELPRCLDSEPFRFPNILAFPGADKGKPLSFMGTSGMAHLGSQPVVRGRMHAERRR